MSGYYSSSSIGSDEDVRQSKAGVTAKGKAQTTKKASKSIPKIPMKATATTLASDATPSSNDIDNNSSIDQQAIGRIRKALKLANHSGTGEAEAKAALRIAHKLMAQQNINLADILDKESKEDRANRAGMSTVEIASLTTNSTPQLKEWCVALGHAINTFFDVQYYSESKKSQNKLMFNFYGIAENTVAAAVSFEFVFNQILGWCAAKLAAREIKGVVASNSYKYGVAHGLYEMAKTEVAEELKAAEEAEKEALRAKVALEKKQRQAEIDRLKDPNPSTASVKIEEIKSEPIKPETVKMAEAPNDFKPESPNPGKPKKEDTEETKPKAEDDGEDMVVIVVAVAVVIKAEPGEEDEVKVPEDLKPGDSKGRRYDSEEKKAKPTGDDNADDSDDDMGADFAEHAPIDMDLDDALAKAEIRVKNETASSPPPIKRARSSSPVIKVEPVKPEVKEEEDDIKPAWKTTGQLTLFRENAKKIGEDFLKQKKVKLHTSKKRAANQHDEDAFNDGVEDAKKIDVKRKRIA